MESEPVRHLYIHVPFCVRKCGYCAFYSEPAGAATLDRYVSGLLREMALVTPGLKPRTVYFGGGTPTLLGLSHWEQILATMKGLGWTEAEEFTVEGNPATVSLEKARLLRAGGVNRFSLGMQSLDDQLLQRLGRVHTPQQARESLELLRRVGFDNLNVDLMFAIPDQTLEAWRTTLAEALAFGSEHLSCYEVIYEEDTPLFEQLRAGQCDVDEDLACDMYDALLDLAEQHGFRQYEIANFARRRAGESAEIPVLACRHNINYWRGGSFQGLGPSAASYIGGVRARNAANTTVYCERLERGERPVESAEQLSPLARAGEIAAFGLRMSVGWQFDEFLNVTGFDLRNEWAADMEWLRRQGLGQLSDNRFHLTRRGLRFADLAAQRFLRP